MADFAGICLQLPPEATYQLAAPELVDYWKDYKKRIIYLIGEITSDNLDLVQKIVQWNMDDYGIPIEQREPIKVCIFSEGGDLDTQNAIVSTMLASETPIYTINLNRCCSAAALIYLAGSQRFALENCYWLFHKGSAGFSGSYNEVMSQIETYAHDVSNLVEYIKSRTDFEEEYLEEQIGGEFYVFKEEALKNNVCHKYISSINEILD